MNTLFATFIVQVILWILLFILICYLVKKNNELKRELEILREAIDKKTGGN